MAFKFSYCTIVMATLMLASSVMGATTVTASIKDKKVTFSGFGGVRKYSVKTKVPEKTYANITICTGDSIKFNWDETKALDKYLEMGQFSNPVSAAALADCPQLWNSQVSDQEKGTKTYKESQEITKYYATSHRYRGGRWSCDASFVVNWKKC